ncbi:MAG TPA: chromo domain-containing protein [Ktedonobacteraceae bacterium]|nr:chromo domain-containing protein [Ktedonobacteraceae bacterium]
MIHVSQLKRYLNPAVIPGRIVEPPKPEIIEQHEEWEIEAIRAKRVRYRRVEYLVKWKGFGEHDNTWIPARNMEHAQELIEEYERALETKALKEGSNVTSDATNLQQAPRRPQRQSKKTIGRGT